MAIFLDNDGIKSNVYLVCFSLSEVKLNIRMVQYLSGITLCAYISAFFLDEEDIGNDLDEVHGKAMNFDQSIGGSKKSILSDLSRSCQSKGASESSRAFQKSYSSSSHTESTAELNNKVAASADSQHCYAAPTWEPKEAFNYPISQVPVLKEVAMLSIGRFGDLGRPVASGTNADVYRSTHNHNMDVAVKVLKKKNANSAPSLQELNMEHGMLVRLSHENIVHILAAGESPQRFIALEFLGGGTLKRLLHGDEDAKKSSSSNAMLSFTALFSKKKASPLALEQVLAMARDMASALDYMHERCWADACFIHRGTVLR